MIHPSQDFPREAHGLSKPELVKLAIQRVREGLPPPREIYLVQNRRDIDWAQFPAWARPSNPELFACHEG